MHSQIRVQSACVVMQMGSVVADVAWQAILSPNPINLTYVCSLAMDQSSPTPNKCSSWVREIQLPIFKIVFHLHFRWVHVRVHMPWSVYKKSSNKWRNLHDCIQSHSATMCIDVYIWDGKSCTMRKRWKQLLGPSESVSKKHIDDQSMAVFQVEPLSVHDSDVFFLQIPVHRKKHR